MRIALGTISKQKKKFLEEILNDFKVLAVIEQYRVLSDLSDEFIDDDKVKQNSVNRAKKAFQEDKKADFSLGIECGYHSNIDEGYEMFCWTTLIDKKGKQLSARSNELLLPMSCQSIEKENMVQEAIRKVLSNYLSK